MSETRGVYTLSLAHAGTVGRLAGDPAIAAALGISHPVSAKAVADWVAAQVQARAEGKAFLFVLSDRGDVRGLCGLTGIGASEAPLFVLAIGTAHRGKGHAVFAGDRVLEFAFQNLQLDRIAARAPLGRPECARVLDRLGFTEQPLSAAPSPDARWELTRLEWRDARARSALAALHPSLRPLLQAELAAGNEVVEMNRGWPEADSVFVRLREAFKARPAALPAGVEYEELNDPHWWKAEYRAAKPRHVLAS